MKRLLLAMLFIVFVAEQNAHGAQKAFVIAIDDYKNIDSLQNPSTDARLVADKLVEVGYQVTRVINAGTTKDELIKRWNKFLESVSAEDDIVVHYSGHGVQIGGDNYLVPSDSPSLSSSAAAANLDLELISFRRLMTNLSNLQVRTQIWIIDACRTNPFRLAGKQFGAEGGLAASDRQPNTFVWYSASYGKIALDYLPGEARDSKLGSPFTRAWLSVFDKKKNSPIEVFAKEQRADLLRLVAPHPQFPIWEDGIVKNWCFSVCDAPSEKRPASEEELGKLFANALKTMRTPTAENNSVYLGKLSAAASCYGPDADNAYPFGCELLKKISARSGGDADVFVPPVRTIKAGVQVNVRKRLPETVGSQLIYECKIARLKPGERISIEGVLQYNLAQDSYFFGLVAGPPKEGCLPENFPGAVTSKN